MFTGVSIGFCRFMNMQVNKKEDSPEFSLTIRQFLSNLGDPAEKVGLATPELSECSDPAKLCLFIQIQLVPGRKD